MSIGALPVAVNQRVGVGVASLPGLPMRRLTDLHPDEGKTDDATLAGLVLAGYDDDLAAEATRLRTAPRNVLAISQALKRVRGHGCPTRQCSRCSRPTRPGRTARGWPTSAVAGRAAAGSPGR